MYEKIFELVLRLKGNYVWPASASSMESLRQDRDLPQCGRACSASMGWTLFRIP